MKPSEAKLQRVIEGANQFVVPLFQRKYSWDSKIFKFGIEGDRAAASKRSARLLRMKASVGIDAGGKLAIQTFTHPVVNAGAQSFLSATHLLDNPALAMWFRLCHRCV